MGIRNKSLSTLTRLILDQIKYKLIISWKLFKGKEPVTLITCFLHDMNINGNFLWKLWNFVYFTKIQDNKQHRLISPNWNFLHLIHMSDPYSDLWKFISLAWMYNVSFLVVIQAFVITRQTLLYLLSEFIS